MFSYDRKGVFTSMLILTSMKRPDFRQSVGAGSLMIVDMKKMKTYCLTHATQKLLAILLLPSLVGFLMV